MFSIGTCNSKIANCGTMGERRRHSVAKNFLVALAIVVSLSRPAFAAVISLPPSINAQTPQNLSSTSNNNHCISDRSWVGSVTYAADCIHAVLYLYETEVGKRRTPKTDYEFLTPKAKAHADDSMRTPRKYTVGMCIILSSRTASREKGVCLTRRRYMHHCNCDVEHFPSRTTNERAWNSRRLARIAGPGLFLGAVAGGKPAREGLFAEFREAWVGYGR